ncbi:MAG: hypothetical protein J6S67_17855 [Methanobrevibacter sp.]|nr:hypothetical protein [Methanobrevibacter sp.]MBO7734435.1 hypothetical protein [Methanobrevibacter sp.]
MAIGRRSRNSRKEQNKNVLKTRTPNNSRNSRGSRRPGNARKSNSSLSSVWSKSSMPKRPRSPRQILVLIIILIAFICGLALGISMIMGIGSEPSPGEVQYMNVTNNISVYENSSYDLHDENGTQISYYDFHENVTEGQDIDAFNASNTSGIY